MREKKLLIFVAALNQIFCRLILTNVLKTMLFAVLLQKPISEVMGKGKFLFTTAQYLNGLLRVAF